MGLIKKFADYAGVKHSIDPTGHTHSTSESWLSTIVNNLTTLINGKEDPTNKVTLLSGQSTNTQYPGALCVYNAINSYIPSAIAYSDETGKLAGFDCHESTTYALMMVNSGGEGDNEIIGFISIDIDNNEAIITADADKIEGTAVTDSLSSTATTEKKIPTSGAVKAALNGKANVSHTHQVTESWIASALNGKSDKVSGATNGNLAALNSNGNLTDSGKKASDFAQASNTYTKTEIDTALSGKEDTSNKVTSWSQQLSDTKYPSEKLVMQSLNEKADYDSPHLVNEVVVSGKIVINNDSSVSGAGNLEVESFDNIVDGNGDTLQDKLDSLLPEAISKGTDSVGASVVCVKNSLSGFIVLTINGTELSIDQTKLQKLAQLLA